MISINKKETLNSISSLENMTMWHDKVNHRKTYLPSADKSFHVRSTHFLQFLVILLKEYIFASANRIFLQFFPHPSP